VHYVALSDVDFDLLESLGDNVQPPIRRDREDRPAFDRPRDRERERRPQQEVAATPVAETPDANRFDLFDPEAAEASRLVPEAQTWNPSETDDESELETRSTVRVAPPIRIGADEPEGENAPEQHAAAETGPEPDDSTVGDDDSDELDTEASSSSES
jgi:hypothetical protein